MKTLLVRASVEHLLCFFLLLSFSGTVFAQTTLESHHPTVESLPQVFTPEAAGLGEYNKVPVNYFNGLPNITIPLTELKGKNANLPVYISYHAGGNKPDEHAGPVGLGWSLHAGGCISRIVNGLKDEYSQEELEFIDESHHFQTNLINPMSNPTGIIPFMDAPPIGPPLGEPGLDPLLYNGPGLFYRWGIYNTVNWLDTSNLNAFALNDVPQDYEPDEFIVNIDGLSASFYFDGSNGIRIVSQTAEDFHVSYQLEKEENPVRIYTSGSSHLDARRFTYIKTLTLTKGDGIRYTFGGNPSNIEFSYQQDTLTSTQRLVGTANTWHLSQIAYPGGETIDFTYEKHGFPIVKTNVHSKVWVNCDQVYIIPLGQEIGAYISDFEYFTNESDYSNLSLTILNPSYLTRIEDSMSGDYLNFINCQTDELESDVTESEFTHLMGTMSGLNRYTFLRDENYHMGVTDIVGPTKAVSLYYRGLIRMHEIRSGGRSVVIDPDAPDPKPRLRLDKIRISGISVPDSERELLFAYDTLSLPPSYNSKFTDHWGYYTDHQYADVLADKTVESDYFYQTLLNNQMDQRRAPNARYMQAEILKEITYPTGGVRKFEYEPHSYTWVVSCFNSLTQQFDSTARYSPGVAGGLRIKSITDSLSTSQVERRTFSYNNSGILSGKPLYGAVGRSRITNYIQDQGYFGDQMGLEIGFTNVTYRIGSERLLNQLSPTSGNHVTYGHVTETFADSSSVTYHYSDHHSVPDRSPLWTESNINCSLLQDPVTSMQLGRGLLLGVDYRDSLGNMVRRDTMTYAQPSAYEYILAISKSNPAPSGVLKRISVNRIAYYHPRLLSKSTTTWMEGSTAQITDTETYIYNGHRRIAAVTRTIGNDSEGTRTLYAEDIDDQGSYKDMTKARYGALPVERLTIRNGKVTGASLTAWRPDQDSTYWAPDSMYVAKLTSSVPLDQWTYFNGTTRSPLYGTSPELAFLTYDSYRNITHAVDKSGHHSYFLWDADGMNLDVVSNKGDIAYIDYGSSPHSGNLTLQYQTPLGVPYVVDYWTGDGDNWTYNRQSYTGAGMSVGASGSYIQKVRIYPQDCKIGTYTYLAPGLLKSVTDGRGVSQYYTYDWERRLAETIDNEGSVEMSHEYHYKTLGTNNYVRQKKYLTSDGESSYTEETRYDGLGRKNQHVKINASTLGYDIAQSYFYDNKGRLFKTTIPRSTRTTFPPAEEYYYSETKYDSSPLDRVRKSFGPGAAWRTGDHSVRYTYLSNTQASNTPYHCSRYSVSFTSEGKAVIAKDGFWPSGTLEVIKTENEDGTASYTYKDMWGQEVLQRVDTLDTYFVYDTLGRLSAVLPPTLSKALSTKTGPVTETACPEIKHYAYLYRYDSRGRCIAKRLPGCAWTYYVYDDADRLIFEQDGNDRAALRWKFTLYDNQDRECVKGTTGITLDPFDNPLSGLNMDVTRSYPIVSEGLYGYTLSGFALFHPTVLTVQWWDDYSFLGKWGVPAQGDMKVKYVAPAVGEPYASAYTTSSTGLQTGMLTKVLGTDAGNTYLWSVNYYDIKGRVVQSKRNHLDGRLMSSRLGYDFAGNVTAKENWYQVSGTNSVSETYTYTYDSCGRPLQTIHKVNNETPVVLRSLGYDSVGRIHSDSRNGDSALNTVYSYNYRDWLTSLRVGANGGTFLESLCYESSADSVFTPRWGGDISSQEWSVGSGVTPVTHKYRFLYDQFSRLTQATHESSDTTFRFTRHYGYDREGNMLSLYKEQRSTTGSAVQITNKTYTYTGHRLSGPEQFAHISDPIVEDPLEPILPEPILPEPLEPEPIIIDPEPVIDPELTLEEYVYDTVGNMIAAYPDNITNISYNILNLPQHVDISQGMLVDLTVDINYSSTGEKLSRQVLEGLFMPNPPRIYFGALVLENNAPYILLVDGGYVTFQLVNNQYQGTYHYYVTDHQGNIRAIVDENGSIEKEYHYDPYGEVVYESAGSSINKYKYSGKEWDANQKAYDFGARMQMPSYARFTTMDPLCEKYYSISPYAYCAGNPVNLVDPDGNDFRKVRRFNRITISADYYTRDKISEKSATQGANFWNNKKPDKYVDPSTGKTFIINYHITVTPATPALERKSHENTYEVNDKKVDELSNQPAVGVTLNHKKIYVKRSNANKLSNGTSSSTPAHEIGHTLGMSDSPTGIMSERQDEKRSGEVLQSNIDEMMNSPAGGEMKTSFLTRVYEKIKSYF